MSRPDCLDIIVTFVFGSMFECHPKLKLACVEADVGTVPHFMYRMGHAWERHRCYAAFQDGWLAFKKNDLCNVCRLMWANNFLALLLAERTGRLLAGQTAYMTKAERDLARRYNVPELYGRERP